MDQPQLTRRQRRLAQREERARQTQKTQPSRIRPWHLIMVLVIIGVVFGVRYAMRNLSSTTPSATYTAEPVHWHAAFEVNLCGVKQDFSSYGSGEHHAGLPLLHTHGDGVIHIEGRILQKEDIALGRFFDGINIPFDRDRIMNKKNGDECAPGKPGQVKMFVNGAPNTEFRNYIPAGTEHAQEDSIKIVFE